MKRKWYVLDILWDNGVLTKVIITEKEKELLVKYKELFILTKYELKEVPEAKPVSCLLWDIEKNPLLKIEKYQKDWEV
ncbi:hypothetical protein ABOONEI_1386 [Aciduliprofundum boonei T469]|nr:hypothetical protein ABOONEI_1386 [Aciduliprofundum boonei T469]